MTDTRLIERWLPIAEIGVESTCERRSMTALLPIYYLTSGGRGARWWRRRPSCWSPLPKETRAEDVE